MRIINRISRWASGMGRVFRNEFKLIVGDVGVLLFFVALPLAYPVVYTLIYNPEVVRELPVAVVDNSRTADSRALVRKAGASPSIEIYAYCNDLGEARDLMATGDVFGIIEIPRSYARSIGRGEQAHVSFYADMSLLLRYRTFVAALTDLQLELVNEITGQRISMAGLGSMAADGEALPVKSESNFLGDTEQGFASFVIPGIVILILQQSMLLGICMIGGSSRERRRLHGGTDPREVQGVGVLATVWGKALACVVFYIPLTIYVMRFIPELFDLPHYGAPIDYLLFIFPLLLSTAFLGQTLVLFMKERESAFIVIVFTSVLFLFLSGLTWPRYAMNELWTWMGNCVPAVWGVEGFIRINSNAASIGEVDTAFKAMWVLAAVYMLTACWVTKWISSKPKVRRWPE